MKKLHLTAITLILLLNVSLEAKTIVSKHGSVTSRHWIIIDDEVGVTQDNLVVFLHGYGASNPACYGAWIEEIVAQGNAVVFPKFQIGLFLPRTGAFTDRTEEAIFQAVEEISQTHSVEIKSISLIGHSIGGVIAANIAEKYGQRDDLQVSSIVLCQPGFKYLKLGAKDSYQAISPKTKVLIITGSEDNAAGRKFANEVWQTIPQITAENKRWIEHFPTELDGEQLKAHHKVPVCPSRSVNSKNINPVILGSYVFCDSDPVDREAYWKPSLAVLHHVNEDQRGINVSNLPEWIVEL